MIIFKTINNFYWDVHQGIKSLIKWFPIIWKDRNWDNYYIYVIIRHKLHLTEQLTRNYGHHLYHIKDAEKIKKCVILLDRLIEDEYHENVYKHFDEKWGQSEFNFTDSTEYPDCQRLHITYPNVITKEDEKLQEKQNKLLMHKPEEMKKQDLDLLFKTMRKHIQTWWD